MGATDFFQTCSIRFFGTENPCGLAFIRTMFRMEIFASSGAERFFASKFGTRNNDFPREVLISVQIFKIERHSAGM